MERYCSENGDFFHCPAAVGGGAWGRGPRGREDIDRGCPEPRQVARRAMRHARGGVTVRGRGMPSAHRARRDGAMGTSRPTATGPHHGARGNGERTTGHGRCARPRGRDAKPRTAPRHGGASREARRPSIAPYRHGARVVGAATGHAGGDGARVVGPATGCGLGGELRRGGEGDMLVWYERK